MRQIYKVYTRVDGYRVVDTRTDVIVNRWGTGDKNQLQAQEFADTLNALLDKQGGNKTPYRVTVLVEVEARDETDAMDMVCEKLAEGLEFFDWSIEKAEEI